mgnify:CR=1 FL=1
MAMKMTGASKKCSATKGMTSWKKMGYSSYQNCMSALMTKGKTTRKAARNAPAKRRATRRTVTRKYKVGGKKGQTVRISISKPRKGSTAGMVSRKSIMSKKRTARKSLGKAMTAHRRRVNGIISRIK